MKKLAVFTVFILAAVIFTSCGPALFPTHNDTLPESAAKETESKAEQTVPDDIEKLTDPSDDNKTASGDFNITPGKDAGDVSVDGNVYIISGRGEYTLTGNLPDGQVIVDAEDEEVTLILKNTSVSSASGAPILFINTDTAYIQVPDGTYNTVTDGRQSDAKKDSESEENYDAAIYSASDLKIKGGGTLIVTSDYDNGIKSKDDLKLSELTLKVTSVGCALKGNDEIKIESGSMILTSTSSDCLKTSNTALSSKDKQKGNIMISGGHLDIYAARDGISAACDVAISEGEKESCTVNIFTSSYAELTEENTDSGEIYLIVPKNVYSDKNEYYAYFYNDEDGVWRKCEFETMIRSGRSANYYGLLVKVPSSYKNLIFCIVKSGEQPDGENHTAASGGEPVNSSMNGYLITDISSGVITGDWVQLTADGGGNPEKTTFSSKGIKAENSINVSGGTVTVYCKDDGMHANSGNKLESKEVSTGDITVSGGSISITSADDGIHADGVLKINGGYVNIIRSHEGLEGNVVEINGGRVYVYADDDGINACKGSSATLVNITGGYVDVTTPSGDTDGIDSNGNITVSGGFTIVKGGASMGGMAGSVDTDGTVTVSGGTVIALGGVCEVPEGGDSVNTYVSAGTSFSAGEYKITGPAGVSVAEFALSASYSSVWIASDKIEQGSSYTVTKDGSNVLEWTQSKQLEGYSGGGFRPGGPGGFGPGGRPGGRK